MDEDDCDYRTPIGKVIKQINSLCKKPPFDNQLSEAIDLFHDKLNEQEKYLVNGIFKINFAESALFLQSCAELYGKKIDLLWNELLEFHTRLIKYDYEHQKEKGAPINKDVIDKLEERRNRYLRKKNFKLLQEVQQQQIPTKPVQNKIDTDYLIDEDGKYFDTDEIIARNQPEEEDKSIQIWRDIEQETRELLKVPYAVHKQMTQTYTLKNYPTLKSEDFEILDQEDGEFNTKYSRVPGWHHILHLIDYNDNGLLPDKNSLIARLKLAVYGKLKFLSSRKMSFDTPFEQYKNEYMVYRENFIKEEAGKWQNVPLETLEDFHKQLEFLTHMHIKEYNMADSCSIKKASQDKNDKIQILDTSDEDSLFELTFNCDKDFMKSDLFVRLEKLSCDIINTKLRQDSGIYEYNSGSDNEDSQTGVPEIDAAIPANTNVNENGSNINNTEASTEVSRTAEAAVPNIDATIPTNANGNENDSNVNKTEVNKENTSDGSNVNVDVNSNYTSCINSVENTEKDDNFDTRSIMSDHDYCDTRSVVSDHDYCIVPPVDLNVSDPVSVTQTVNEPTKNNKVLNKTVEEVFKVPLGTARVIPKIVKIRETVRKHPADKNTENAASPPKRRKLSQRQIETLLKSKVTPVKLLKFEKFFSENYQPEDGEGDIETVEYESDDSDAENEQPGDHNVCLPFDDDDTRSVLSDHSYCQALPENSRNDSGFVEGLSQESQTNNLPGEPTEKQSNTTAKKSASLEDEYERLLAMLRSQTNERDPLPSSFAERYFGDKETVESRERVEEWRNTINPILRSLKEHDFDIHEYGSRIIEGMEVNESKPFSNIVQGKSSAEVVRYFISSLQLANTNNIEISGAKKGQLSNDSYCVKLLTKDRYHEHLNEYLAPSEETLAEKLERVRAMSAQQRNSGIQKDRQVKLTEKTYKGKRSPHDIKKKIVVKVTKLTTGVETSQRDPVEMINHTYHHNKENYAGVTPVIRDETPSGKSIMKRQVNTPRVLNFDISLPSTSRHINFSESPPQMSVFDPQMPSTSQMPTFLPSQNSELENQRSSPNACDVSPNKRRRSESTEESFLERLVVAQRMNPDIQVHSTPHGPSPTKRVRVYSTSKKSILF